MRRLLIILLAVQAWGIVVSQSPEAMSFQTVIRDSNSILVHNTQVGIQISVLQGSINGSASYIERHSPTTNDNGLATLEIGNGTVQVGSFSGIDWSNGPYFLKTDIDLTGNNIYSISGASQLLSVPYALFAKEVANKNDSDADPTNELQTLMLIGDTLVLTQGNQVVIPNGDNWTSSGNQTYNSTPGQVGINTTNPSADLDVNGMVRVRSLTPNGLVWADSSGNLTSVGSGGKFESLVGQGANVEPIWADSTVYATTGNSDSGSSSLSRNSWVPGNKSLLVPEDGTYLIIFNARLHALSTDDQYWKTRIQNVTSSNSLGTFFGMTKFSAPLNGDVTTTGTLIDHLQKNDELRIEYYVLGSGTSPFFMGDLNGIQAIHLVRIGK